MHRRNVHKEEEKRKGNISTEGKPHVNNRPSQSSISCKKLCTLATYVLIGFVIVLFSIYLFVDAPIDAAGFRLSPPQPSKPNTTLRFAERLYENELMGPESLVFHEGHIYTGTADGKILDIVDGKIRTLATLGQPPCGGNLENEVNCGRPLGMRLHQDGFLIVLDAYFGVFKVDINTGSYQLLLSSETKIDGITPKFLNDLDIGPDGVIYLTDSSTKWRRKNFALLMFEGRATGRLIRFDPSLNRTDVLIRNLLFANGVQLSKDNDFVLVVESAMARIHRYYLKGDKMGTADVFADNLPAFPDNIRRSRSGGYWVGSSKVRKPGLLSFAEKLMNYPRVKNLIATLLPQQTIIKLNPTTGCLLELDQYGRLVRYFVDPQRENILSVSEIHDANDALYFGSYVSPFIGKFHT